MIETVVTTVATSGVILVALRFLASQWIAVRLKESISAEYQRAFERFKGDLGWQTRRREQAAQIAEVISLFIRLGQVGQTEVNALRAELQSKYWALALWLDAPTLRELTKAFVGTGEPGLQHKIALIQVRKLIVGENDDVTAGELCHWDPVSPPANVPIRDGAASGGPPNPALNPTDLRSAG